MFKFEIKGNNKKGKKILILSGIHGDELTPIYCTYLLTEYKPSLSVLNFSTLSILSNINMEGIKANTREIPPNNGNDINRMLKTDVTRFDIKELEQQIDWHDIIIDIHSSPNITEFILINQGELANSYVEFCKYANIDYAVRYSANDTIKKYAIDKGRIAFTLELNGMDIINKQSAENGRQIIRKMISAFEYFYPKKTTPTQPELFQFYTYEEGIIINRRPLGVSAKDGDVLCQILNLNDFTTKDIILNKEGTFKIIAYHASDFVDANNAVCLLQPI